MTKKKVKRIREKSEYGEATAISVSGGRDFVNLMRRLAIEHGRSVGDMVYEALRAAYGVELDRIAASSITSSVARAQRNNTNGTGES